MHDILKDILVQKHKEVALLKSNCPKLCEKVHPRVCSENKSLRYALKNKKISVIAEIKRRSPSKGEMAAIENPVSLAQEYVSGEANAISILTDKKFFGGSLQDMTAVSISLKDIDCPVLRKDFIVDKYQIYESVAAGADAVLLIVSVLGSKTRKFLEITKKMNIEALVEVHTKTELEIAIDSGAEIIGINNRDLNTFQVDINRSLELIALMPKCAVKVAESGVSSADSAEKFKNAGFDAILVGEALVRAKNPSQFIKDLKC